MGGASARCRTHATDSRNVNSRWDTLADLAHNSVNNIAHIPNNLFEQITHSNKHMADQQAIYIVAVFNALLFICLSYIWQQRYSEFTINIYYGN